jgi:hypothetical protein
MKKQRSTRKRRALMPTRKLLVLAGLALAIAALAPASALAKKGGMDRPVKGKASGEGVFCPVTGAGSGDSHGQATHLGKFTAHAELQVTGFTPPNIFEAVGNFTLVAANGDEVTGTLAGTSMATGPGPIFTGHIATYVLTITGGTGRFDGASGRIESVQEGTALFRDEAACLPLGEAHDFNQETITGHVSY